MENLLIILALYLPFQLATNPASDIDLASIRLIILAAFLLWLATGFKNKKITITKSYPTFFVVIFLFINLLSLFWAGNTDWAGRKLLFLFSIFPLYFVVSSVITDYSKVIKLTKALLAGGFLVALLGLVQFFGQFIFGLDQVYKFWAQNVVWPFLGKSFSEAVLKNTSWLVGIGGKTYLRAIATFPDPHMFSFFLGMLISLALCLWLATRKNLYLIFGVILTMVDVLTFSRGGYLGILGGLLVMIIFFWGRMGKIYKIAGLVVFLIIIIALSVPSPISQRFFSSFNLEEGSNQGRLEIWSQALGVVRDHPILGVGLGNYPLAINPTADYRDPIYAHNTYLDIWTETGIFALLAWLGMLLAAILACLKKARQNIFFLGAAAGLIIFSIHSFFETGIYSPVVLTLLVILIGFSNVKIENEKMA